MQQVTLDKIQPGMFLVKPLFSPEGKVLLHAGIEMKERYIRYLRNMGITSLFVGQPDEMNYSSQAECSWQARQTINDNAQNAIGDFRVGKGIQLDDVKIIVGNIIGQLSRDPGNMVYLLDLHKTQHYMFSHAVNTCILSIMTALSLGYQQTQMEQLGLAAMLHDIGKTKLSAVLTVQFPNSLSRVQREEYRRHPFYALEILRRDPNVSEDVINACFQHQERWNGSGYPLGIEGAAISEYAQIIGISAVYDRLMVGLPHRLSTPVYYAGAILNKAAGVYFNPALVEKFHQNIAVYPMGKTVQLSNRQRAILLGVSLTKKNTPIVRILADEHQHGQPVEIDLLKNPDLFIIDFEDQYFNHAQTYADRAYIKNVKILPG